jgi:hypothetical protein
LAALPSMLALLGSISMAPRAASVRKNDALERKRRLKLSRSFAESGLRTHGCSRMSTIGFAGRQPARSSPGKKLLAAGFWGRGQYYCTCVLNETCTTRCGAGASSLVCIVSFLQKKKNPREQLPTRRESELVVSQEDSTGAANSSHGEGKHGFSATIACLCSGDAIR